MSKGARELLEIVRKIYPNQRIITEHHVGEKLLVDIYIPTYRLAFEFDGEQHFRYTEYFHGDRQGFVRAQKRDLRKDELCQNQDITLVRVAYNEQLEEENIRSKIMEMLDGKT